MRLAARRPFAAWIALVAILASLALPAHATSMLLAKGAVHGDLCVGGKLVPAAPADVAHDCDACGGSTASAPPAVVAAAPVVDRSSERASTDGVASNARLAARSADARAPPR